MSSMILVKLKILNLDVINLLYGVAKMVELTVKLPKDFGWILKRSEDMEWVEKVLINKIIEVRLGDILAEKSELKEDDIDGLDHIVKKSLYKKLKVNE